MDCQNHSSDRAGEDGAWTFRSPYEADGSAAVLPGMSLRGAQQEELAISGF